MHLHIKNKIQLAVLHCLAPLLLGGLIYILFRSTELRMFKWLSFLGLKSETFSARAVFSEFKIHLPNWFLYSLPDGLWTYSFTSALIIYWGYDNHELKIWLLIPLISGLLVEILQGIKFFPGTFDYLDLFFSSSGLLLSYVIIKQKFKHNEKVY
jgi:hypothetical protein